MGPLVAAAAANCSSLTTGEVREILTKISPDRPCPWTDFTKTTASFGSGSTLNVTDGATTLIRREIIKTCLLIDVSNTYREVGR